MADLSTSNPYGNPSPQGDTTSDDVLRQTEHRAMTQPAPADMPQVSYEAEDYQPAPSLDTYQPPVNTAPASVPSAPVAAAVPPTPTPTPNWEATVPAAAPATPPTAPPTIPPDTAQNSSRFPGIEKPLAEEVVLEWESPSRPFKKRGRQYYSTSLIIMLLLSICLILIGQYLPIAVVIAVGFLAYVLSVVPPGLVKHSITTYGIRIEDTLYYWDELGRFWFTEKYGKKIVHVELNKFPWRITMLLGDLTEAEMTEILSEVLLLQKPIPSAMEKASEWLQAKFPLDNDHA